MDDEKKENFHEIRKILREEENLLGKKEFNGIQFTRKYVNNINDPFTRLYYTNVKPSDVSKVNLIANLCIVHGFGHYSAMFLEFAYAMAKEGINCHLIDLRSHGFSGGTRFDFTVEGCHEDIITLIKQAENDSHELPLYIMGHSLGGGLVTSLFINNQYIQVHGIILSSPLLSYPLNLELDNKKLFFLSRFGQNLKVYLF